MCMFVSRFVFVSISFLFVCLLSLNVYSSVICFVLAGLYVYFAAAAVVVLSLSMYMFDCFSVFFPICI